MEFIRKHRTLPILNNGSLCWSKIGQGWLQEHNGPLHICRLWKNPRGKTIFKPCLINAKCCSLHGKCSRCSWIIKTKNGKRGPSYSHTKTNVRPHAGYLLQCSAHKGTGHRTQQLVTWPAARHVRKLTGSFLFLRMYLPFRFNESAYRWINLRNASSHLHYGTLPLTATAVFVASFFLPLFLLKLCVILMWQSQAFWLKVWLFSFVLQSRLRIQRKQSIIRVAVVTTGPVGPSPVQCQRKWPFANQ